MDRRVGVIARPCFQGRQVVKELAHAGWEPVASDPFNLRRRPRRDLGARDAGVAYRHSRASSRRPIWESLPELVGGSQCVHLLNPGDWTGLRPSTASHRLLTRSVPSPDWDQLTARLRAAGTRQLVVGADCRTRGGPSADVVDETAPPRTGRAEHDQVVRREALAVEKLVAAGRRAGLRTVVILAGNPLGPEDYDPSPLGARLIAYLNGQSVARLGLHSAFPAVDVRDVARAHALVTDAANPRDVYMVVASTLTARGWARLCARVSGLPARYRLVPAPLAIPTTYAMGLVELLAGKERQLGCAELRQIRGPRRYDSSSATNGLGLPLTPLETTLRDAVAWYAHHGFITDDARLAIVNAALERAAYDAVQPGRVTPPSAPATA